MGLIMIHFLMGFTLFIIKFIIIIFEGCFWLMHFAYVVSVKIFDANRALQTVQGGALHCPEGHLIETEDEAYECTVCNYTYIGSIWICANPECRAVTPYVNCPICGISVRNPYRWGRP